MTCWSSSTPVKYARQNSIHASPTVLFNGLVANEVSSSWGEKEWTEFFDAKIPAWRSWTGSLLWNTGPIGKYDNIRKVNRVANIHLSVMCNESVVRVETSTGSVSVRRTCEHFFQHPSRGLSIRCTFTEFHNVSNHLHDNFIIPCTNNCCFLGQVRYGLFTETRQRRSVRCSQPQAVNEFF